MRKLLNNEQENWLYANYPDKTNKELADILTEMVRQENLRQIERLEGVLRGLTDKVLINEIKKRIASYNMFRGISVDYVKKQSQILKCPPKSASLISETSRKRAEETNIKLWKTKAENVTSHIIWFRSFNIHDTKVCNVKGDKDMKSIRTAMSRWNRLEGYDKGIFLESSYVKKANLLIVKARINRAL